MITTRDVIRALRRANPEAHVTDDRVRSAIRRERCSAPQVVAGRYLWSADDMRSLAAALGLRAPNLAPQDHAFGPSAHDGDRQP